MRYIFYKKNLKLRFLIAVYFQYFFDVFGSTILTLPPQVTCPNISGTLKICGSSTVRSVHRHHSKVYDLSKLFSGWNHDNPFDLPNGKRGDPQKKFYKTLADRMATSKNDLDLHKDWKLGMVDFSYLQCDTSKGQIDRFYREKYRDFLPGHCFDFDCKLKAPLVGLSLVYENNLTKRITYGGLFEDYLRNKNLKDLRSSVALLKLWEPKDTLVLWSIPACTHVIGRLGLAAPQSVLSFDKGIIDRAKLDQLEERSFLFKDDNLENVKASITESFQGGGIQFAFLSVQNYNLKKFKINPEVSYTDKKNYIWFSDEDRKHLSPKKDMLAKLEKIPTERVWFDPEYVFEKPGSLKSHLVDPKYDEINIDIPSMLQMWGVITKEEKDQIDWHLLAEAEMNDVVLNFTKEGYKKIPLYKAK